MIRRARLLPCALLALAALGAPVLAFEPALPFPVLEAAAEPAAFDSYALPTGPFAAGALPVQQVEGMVDRRAWRLEAPGASLLQVLAPLRDQLLAAGYTVLLDCETRACGGFDFRFATEVMAEPAMHVDIGEFRFLSARRQDGRQDGRGDGRGDEAVSLIVSRSGAAAFVQMIHVGATALPPPAILPGAAPSGAPPATESPAPQPAVTPVPPAGPALSGDVSGDLAGDLSGDLAARLAAGFAVALDDLVFASGASELAGGDYASLAALAGWLAADPARRVVLVGHTDGSGGLGPNVALSRKRAEAVRQVLLARHGVDAAQISAEGAGPLAPRDTNLSEAGRLKNRRVEAVPAPTQ